MGFKVVCTDGNARRGEFTSPHGTAQTPVFMNVGTQAAIKGGLSAGDLFGSRRRLRRHVRKADNQFPTGLSPVDGSVANGYRQHCGTKDT